MTWRLDALADRFLFRPMINRCRRAIRLPSLRQSGLEHMLGAHPILAADEVLAPLPDDVALPVTRIGNLQLPQDMTLGAGIRRFLEEGGPPVYVGFGSMPHHHRRRILDLMLEAVRSVGKRLVFSWGIEEKVSDECFLLADTVHPLLFPKLSLIVHHGGAGTTATASRSGIPQLVIPHILDQFYWARQVDRLGIGPAPLWRSRLNRIRLEERLHAVLSDPAYARRAARIRAILKTESREDVVANVLA